jgi:hypothetical protein
MRGNFFAELKRRSHPLDRSARACAWNGQRVRTE